MPPPTLAEIRAQRLAYAKEHLRCPHCEQELERWDMPENPFSDWSSDHVYVCVHKDCSYFVDSIQRIAEQGAPGGAYCFVYDPVRNWCGPMAARTPPAPRG